MNSEIIEFEDVQLHPGSSGHGAVLFIYNGRLFRAPHNGNVKKVMIELGDESVPIQKSIKTDYILNHPKYKQLPVFEHKFYTHVVRINESVPSRAIEFVKTICTINEHIIPKGYVLTDVHEGNLCDTIDDNMGSRYGHELFNRCRRPGTKN